MKEKLYILKGEYKMSKETKNENVETEIKVEVVKKESFWKRNRQKITKALEITGASIVSFVAGMITSDILFNKQMTAMKEPEKEPETVPFELDEEVSE